MVPFKSLDDDHDTKALYEEGEIRLAMGPGCYIVMWSQYARQQMYFAVLDKTTTENNPDWRDQTSQEISAYLQKRLSGWAPLIQKMLARIDVWTPWQVYVGRADLDWVSRSGKCVLIGDAAHAMTADAAQGISQGLEDIEALTTLLNNVQTIPEATRLYQQLRKPRATRIQQYAAANSPTMALKDGPEQEARDRRMKEISKTAAKVDLSNVEPDMHASFVEPSFRKWTIEYCVTDEALKLAGTVN